jgi:methylmalonyl-CoA mutase
MPTSPDPSAWQAAAQRALKGAALKAFRTPDGLTIEPLYGPGRSPRQAPLARASGQDRPWDIRVRIEHPDPAAANRLALEALEGGASSLLLAAPTSAEALARTLDGIVLEAATVALEGSSLEAAQWLAAAAKGSPRARLGFHLTDVKATKAAAPLAGAYPLASLFLAGGILHHEAGGAPALELGVAVAQGLGYARALSGAGIELRQAFDAVALGLAVDDGILTSIAKLRAAREIWGRITAACGAASAARIEARSSGRMLQSTDPWTNLLRLTAAGFAAAVGGADAIVLGTFTDALGRPAERARRISRNIQLILMEECGLGQVADPAAGAWAVEALTDQLAHEGWAAFQEIERRGGPAAARPWIADEAAKTSAARAAAGAPILGVTVYPDPDPAPVELGA